MLASLGRERVRQIELRPCVYGDRSHHCSYAQLGAYGVAVTFSPLGGQEVAVRVRWQGMDIVTSASHQTARGLHVPWFSIKERRVGGGGGGIFLPCSLSLWSRVQGRGFTPTTALLWTGRLEMCSTCQTGSRVTAGAKELCLGAD